MGKKMIALTLPYPISVNAMYRNVQGKGRAKTERYKTWLQAAGWSLRAAKPKRLEGPFIFEMNLYTADQRRRDVDNTIKPILDLLVEHQLIEDDSKCVELHVRKVRSDTAYAEIKVRSAIEERKAA
jgi:crossover junction endodeoxyribonuclease RusA